jgi:hypothetical protein
MTDTKKQALEKAFEYALETIKKRGHVKINNTGEKYMVGWEHSASDWGIRDFPYTERKAPPLGTVVMGKHGGNGLGAQVLGWSSGVIRHGRLLLSDDKLVSDWIVLCEADNE